MPVPVQDRFATPLLLTCQCYWPMARVSPASDLDDGLAAAVQCKVSRLGLVGALRLC